MPKCTVQLFCCLRLPACQTICKNTDNMKKKSTLFFLFRPSKPNHRLLFFPFFPNVRPSLQLFKAKTCPICAASVHLLDLSILDVKLDMRAIMLSDGTLIIHFHGSVSWVKSSRHAGWVCYSDCRNVNYRGINHDVQWLQNDALCWNCSVLGFWILNSCIQKVITSFTND